MQLNSYPRQPAISVLGQIINLYTTLSLFRFRAYLKEDSVFCERRVAVVVELHDKSKA